MLLHKTFPLSEKTPTDRNILYKQEIIAGFLMISGINIQEPSYPNLVWAAIIKHLIYLFVCTSKRIIYVTSGTSNAGSFWREKRIF